MLAQKRVTASRPTYSNGIGGIDVNTSSVSSATSASRSADSHARTNFATIASSADESAAGARGRLIRRGCDRGEVRSEEHTSELQSRRDIVCRLLLENKNSKERSASVA